MSEARKQHSMRKVEIIACGCGCGKKLNKYDRRNRVRKYLAGHFQRKRCKSWHFKKGATPWNKGAKGLTVSWNKGNKGYKAGSRHYNWKGGKPNCKECGKQLSTYKAELCKKHAFDKIDKRKAGLKGVIAQSQRETNIERVVREYLTKKEVNFISQKLINGRFLVDFYVKGENLIIECDGEYWHSLERVIKKDKSENAYLSKCGFNLVRLKESEILDGSFINSLSI